MGAHGHTEKRLQIVWGAAATVLLIVALYRFFVTPPKGVDSALDGVVIITCTVVVVVCLRRYRMRKARTRRL